MKLQINDLGPLRDVSLDLDKPLTVVTGPNNSGKTYLIWCVYGLLRQRVSGQPTSQVAELARRLVATRSGRVSATTLAEVQRRFGDDLSEAFREGLSSFFDAPAELFENARPKLSLSEAASRLAGVHYELALHNDQQLYARLETKRKTTTLSLTVRRISRETQDRIQASQKAARHLANREIWREPTISTDSLNPKERAWAIRFVAQRIEERLRDDLPKPVIFPTERVAISAFARELDRGRSELVNQVLAGESASVIRDNARLYPVPIRDALRTANSLDLLCRRTSNFTDLALQLEALLGGRVESSDDGELLFAPNGAGNLRLPFQLGSSMVKSLASLVFFLRHQANGGELLIIDEPELDLHPDQQRKIARFLGVLVRHGFRLLISTHSDYVVRELSNLVRLAAREDGRKLATELGYDPDCLLASEQIAAYFLREGRAETLALSPDEGFFVPTIDDVIDAQNHDTDRIRYS